ncbi:MAG: DUF6766 family protein [Mycobacteriales bacterium]
MKVRRWIWLNALSLVMFGAFVIFLILQSVFGWHAENAEAAQHAAGQQSYLAYLASGAFVEATFENWESEFLQIGSYVVLTAYLVQRGSAESKPISGRTVSISGEAAPRREGFGGFFYNNSLAILLLGMFVLSFVLHLLGGTAAYNAEQIQHGQPRVSVLQFLTNSEFWFQSMQNWQSEFLAVGVLVVATIFLRQRGSSQSKRVDDPNTKTGG